MKYFTLLTKLGENLLAQATALGTKLELTHMSVGDGGGALPTPSTNQTKLIAEKRRAAINTLFIDEKNPNQIIAEQIIPEQDGGWWIREIGLFDKAGNLIAIANSPETYKPQLAEGSGRTQTIRIVLIVSHTEPVTLKIDPSVVLATREYVDDSVKKNVDEHEKSRKHPDASTTAKGMVQLADVLSTDNTKAVTPKLATEINQRALSAQTTANTAVNNAATAQTAANNANSNANNRVPNTRKVNNKPLNADITLNAGDVGAHSKEESNAALALKFDKAGGEVDGAIAAKSVEVFDANTWIQLDVSSGTPTVKTQEPGKDIRYHYFPDSNGTLLQAGDFGIGTSMSHTGMVNIPDANEFNVTGCAASGAGSVNFFGNPAPMFSMIRMGGADGTGFVTQIQGDSKTRIAFRQRERGIWLGWYEFLTEANTTKDPNGFVRTGTATALTTSNIVQSTGASTLNTMSQKAITDGLNTIKMLGNGQKWTDVKSGRQSGVNYTNSTGRTIALSVSTVAGNAASAVIIYVDGVKCSSFTVGGNSSDFTRQSSGNAIIPVGSTYRVEATNIELWAELR